MGFLEDVMKAVERIPGWKRIAATPQELDELRVRVERLEKYLASTSGDQCPKCRAMHFKLQRSESDPDFGNAVMHDYYQCSACGYTDVRTRS